MRLYAIFAHIAIVNYRPEKPNIVSHRVVICRITEYAIPFQQIRPYDDQQTIKYLFLKRERGEGEGIRARQEATNDYLQEGTVPRQNLPTPSKQTGNPPMQRRLLLSSLSSPTLTKRHQRTP